MKQISVNDLKIRLQNGEKLNIIDVREPKEIALGKIPASENIPTRLIEFKMPDLDKKKEYIIVCQSGARSSLVTKFLDSYGFNVVNLDGGMLAWQGGLGGGMFYGASF
ncbi:MAG: rhodanese-like domain protein [Bacillales bacterium]|jgi:rhodanese-related sulfurtransferase|nr:rhodanese-like domain protein [Bacillales bacterium]